MNDFTQIEDLESEKHELEAQVETLEHDNKALQLNVDDALKDLDTLNESYQALIDSANAIVAHGAIQKKVTQQIIDGLKEQELLAQLSTLSRGNKQKMELTQAHAQWVDRPADKVFVDLDSLIAFTEGRRKIASERVVDMASIEFGYHNDELAVFDMSEKELLGMSHWSFGQMSCIVGAPAKYLRSLSPGIVRNCLNYSLRAISGNNLKRFHKAFIHNPSTGQKHSTLSAMTSETYGRVYDADVAHQVKMAIENKSWVTLPQSVGVPSGLYAGDRDMFIFLINEEDKIEVGNALLSRGFFVSNSEVGSSTLTVTSFLYNHVCANHIIFGTQKVREIKVFHRRFAPDRFEQDVIPAIESLAHDATYETEIKDRVYAAMRMKLGDYEDQVFKFFKDKAFTKRETLLAFAASVKDGDDPTTLWGMIQGFTAIARDIPNMDQRNDLDRRAGNLLNLIKRNR